MWYDTRAKNRTKNNRVELKWVAMQLMGEEKWRFYFFETIDLPLQYHANVHKVDKMRQNAIGN